MVPSAIKKNRTEHANKPSKGLRGSNSHREVGREERKKADV